MIRLAACPALGLLSFGTRDGVDIEVLIRRGEIWTGYPTNVPRNP